MKPKSSQKSFTLIEIIVVVAIIIFISAIVLANYRNSQGQLNLQRSVHKLAQDIRLVQEMTMAAKECTVCNPPQIPPRYGVYLPAGDSSNPAVYIIFADLDNNGLFYISTDQQISKKNYEEGVIHKTIESIDVNCLGSLPPPSRRWIHITFSPPDPLTEIKIGDTSSSINCSQVRINLQFGTVEPIKSIKVNKVGLIEIE